MTYPATLVLVVALAAGGVSLARALTDRCPVSSTLVPTCGAWWGMYVPGEDDEVVGAVTAEQRSLGRPLDILELYHDMSLSANGIFPNRSEETLARSHLLLLSWAPDVWSTNTEYPWSLVASGKLDRSVIVPAAKRLRAFHHTVFFTFSAEPDGSIPALGTPAQFVAAWRHVHDVFARLGVHNAVWVWTTEGYLPHAGIIAASYPGDAYVDWIGYDPYNYFTCHGAKWKSFAETVGPFYHWLMAHQFGDKPFMLAEFGTVPDSQQPGRQAAWYRSIGPVVGKLPNIKALIQWNSTVPRCNLSLPSASGAAHAFRQDGLSSYFNQEVP